MIDIVFVLGAGASKEAGAPLMLEFLDVADRLNRTDKVAPNAKQAFDDVAKARAALDAVHAKATIDADNLEDVFAAFDMAQLFRRFGDMDRELVHRLPAALRTVIAEVLEKTVRFPVLSSGSGGRRIAAPGAYEPFAALVKKLSEERGDAPGVITFNYDVGLDYAFHREGLDIDYCLKDSRQVSGYGRPVDVMKLHGSVNWTACPQCGIAAYRFEKYLKEWGPQASGLFDLREVSFDFRNRLKQFDHCNAARGPEEPAIIPPTWNKGAHHYPQIESVWRRAAGHFATARTIVVVGYSLPSTDQFFRYLYAIGSLGATRLERFIVLNPDTGVRDKFESVLGRGVTRRFMYYAWPFSNAVADLPRLLVA